jgi:hypothetical protein
MGGQGMYLRATGGSLGSFSNLGSGPESRQQGDQWARTLVDGTILDAAAVNFLEALQQQLCGHWGLSLAEW